MDRKDPSLLNYRFVTSVVVVVSSQGINSHGIFISWKYMFLTLLPPWNELGRVTVILPVKCAVASRAYLVGRIICQILHRSLWNFRFTRFIKQTVSLTWSLIKKLHLDILLFRFASKQHIHFLLISNCSSDSIQRRCECNKEHTILVILKNTMPYIRDSLRKIA